MGRPPRITRDQILVAARASFGARGFAATTLGDIAAQLHVTAAAILRHFDSKEALFRAAMSTRAIVLPPFVDALAAVPGNADPRAVLRDFARQLLPFLTEIIRPAIAVQMHSTTVVVPFDPKAEEVPPRRVIRTLAEYLERAMNARRVRRADAHALALLFVGQLQAYIFFHQILQVRPAYPLDDYIDTLIDLWTAGVIRGGTSAQKTDRDRGRGGDRRDGGGAVHAQEERAETARPQRNARGKNGERGVTRRRTSGPRSRR